MEKRYGLGGSWCLCLEGAYEACNGPRCSVMKAQGLEDEDPAVV